MTLQNRNKEIRRVRVSDIVDNPANFRTHDDLQRGALESVVGEIGWYGYPDVFEHPEHPGKVMLVDGELRSHHLREHYGPDAAIDVNVCDFSPGEADKALATKDPLSAMAKIDIAAEADLLRSLDADSEGFGELIEQLAAQDRIELDPLPETIWEEIHGIPQATDELAEFWELSPDSPWEYRSPSGIAHRVLIGEPGNAEDIAELFDGAEPTLLVSKPRAEQTGTVYRLFTGPVCYLFYSHNTCVEIVGHLHEQGFEIRAQLVWRRESEDDPERLEYHAHHRCCFYAVRRGNSAKWNGSRTESTVWDAGVPAYGALPLEVAGRPLVNHGSADDAVFDPYGESTKGSVAVAADRLGRPSFTMCQTPADAAVVVERLMREWGRSPQ